MASSRPVPSASGRPIIVASNRGPVSFVRDEAGKVVTKRGTGGLVTALSGALQLSGGLWIASAMTDEDRKQVAKGHLEEAAGEAHHDLRYLSFDPRTYDGFYNGISNRVLWFAHHLLGHPQNPRVRSSHHTGMGRVRADQS